ncbi:putative ribonuclease H-like domain-containing protein, partial [Tanacetum coccineum]
SKDETSGILKRFITEIENLVDKKVKIIRCDNRTELKNRVMSEFCKKKGIKKEFSVARTPQQNGVAERRNRTLIEAARTMLADSKLPTKFWAEAVNTACYVQNRVLVVKPHNKTPYELFRGRTSSLSFMRPFGCHVSILITLDHLGKFDEKSDEGFFVGYSLNSKACRVYNIRTRKVEENLHIRFLEDKPIIAGDGQSGCHFSKETGSSKDYILIPLWKDGSLFDSSSKNACNNDPQPSSDAEKKVDEGELDNQEMPKRSTQDFNTVGPSINTASTNVNSVDMSNITSTYLVPSTPNTRIRKDHSLDHVIGDVKSGVQTRRMTRTTNEQGFISAVYEGKTHEDLHTCLFACFLSQEEPKKVYRNKKDKRGIMIRNKARLAAQGYTQEEDIDYDEVFALVARIEAIRLFLAYGSLKDFVVYQMDVKSAFIYGKIEEEVYVCQPLWFEDPEFPDKVYKVEKALYGLHQAPRAWPDIIFDVCACARFQVTPKVSLCHAVKRISRYLKGQPKLGLWYPKDIPFELEAYTDSDYAGAIANSTTEAEYVDVASCCGQVLWIQNQMLDYGYNFMNTKIFIDNESTICIVKNPVFHSRTKHIKIRHHFIKDSNEKRLIQMIKIHTDQNIIDLLTNSFDVSRFQYLIANVTVSKEWEVRMERAATTASSLEAE